MHPGLLIGAGFLLGTAGVKAATSKTARKGYVKTIACGLKAKEEVETVIDEAKAEFDDMMAEAGYEKKAEAKDGEKEEAQADEA